MAAEARRLRRGGFPADLRHRGALFDVRRGLTHVLHWAEKEEEEISSIQSDIVNKVGYYGGFIFITLTGKILTQMTYLRISQCKKTLTTLKWMLYCSTALNIAVSFHMNCVNADVYLNPRRISRMCDCKIHLFMRPLLLYQRQQTNCCFKAHCFEESLCLSKGGCEDV